MKKLDRLKSTIIELHDPDFTDTIIAYLKM
jgi:hypothetical protein